MGNVLPSELLADQHRRIDQGVKDVLDARKQPTVLAEALALLRRHLYMEEAVLFPPLVKSGLAMPIFVMKREHGQMWALMQTLTDAYEAGGSAATLHDPCRELFQLLQIHNTKEERIVYSAADRLEDGHADGSLTRELEAARMPDGWTCEMAPP